MGSGTSNPGIPRVAISDGAIAPNKLHACLRDGSYFFDDCNYQPVLTSTDGTGNPPGTDTSEFLAHFKRGSLLGHCIGASTVLGPALSTTTGNLGLQLDKTNGEGVEYAFDIGDNIGKGPFAHTVGTSAPMVIRLKFTIDDVSELGECAVGFRKKQAFDAAIDNYTDFAVINVQAGTINVETNLNDAGTDTTDSGLTWADGAEHELKVTLGKAAGSGAVSGAGVARFFVDGVEVGAPFTFDSSDVLVPFVHILQSVAASGAAVEATEFEVGKLADIDDFYSK